MLRLNFIRNGTSTWEESVVIDIRDEELLTLKEAASRLPKRQGKKLHISTLYRWAKNGLSGTHLETIRIGGSVCTSVQAMQRFFNHLSKGASIQKETLARGKQRESLTNRILKDAQL